MDVMEGAKGEEVLPGLPKGRDEHRLSNETRPGAEPTSRGPVDTGEVVLSRFPAGQPLLTLLVCIFHLDFSEMLGSMPSCD